MRRTAHRDEFSFQFAASVDDSAVLIVDANLEDIEFAKAKVLLGRYSELGRLETKFAKRANGRNGKTRTSRNPLADQKVLDDLRSMGVKRLIICGDDVYGGVSTAALSALELGFDVSIIDDATTFHGKSSRKLITQRLWSNGGVVLAAQHLAHELEQSRTASSTE